MLKTFNQKLEELRAGSCAMLPAQDLAVLIRSIGRLKRSSILQQCLEVGETVPNFIIQDNHRLYDLLEAGHVILNFFRGHWCAYCQTEMAAWKKLEEQLGQIKTCYVAISPDTGRSTTDAMVDRTSCSIEFFDRNNALAKLFGLVYQLEEEEIELFRRWGVELVKDSGPGKWELPLPATYLVAPNREVVFRFVDADYRVRCCPEDLMAVLKEETG